MSCEDIFVLKKCIECNLYLGKECFRKWRKQCKECVKIKERCEHGKIKQICKLCYGSGICEHNKQKAKCKLCGSSSYCIHNKQKQRCKLCGGNSICEHNKEKSRCYLCGGRSICEHKVNKYQCRLCSGKGICEHNKIRTQCKSCSGSAICEHDKRKSNCIICIPNCACTDCKSVYSDKRTFCYPLCQPCFCNKYPDHEKSTLFKIKERYLRDELRERFKEHSINMIFDKTVDGGCSKKRPDVLIDCLTHSIVIECDEHQHVNYECENKRTMQLFEDLGNRPLVLFRFNPDKYVDENEEKVQGCFIPLTKVEDIHKRKFYNINETEWARRVNILEQKIKEYLSLDTFPNKEVTEIKLFYSR